MFSSMTKTPTLKFLTQLEPSQRMRFVPKDVNWAEAGEVKSLFELLLSSRINSSEDLENWLLDRSELESSISEAGAIFYIKMTCQTDDVQSAEDYKNFITTVIPVVKPLEHKLNGKYLNEIKRFALLEDYYSVHDRSIKAEVELFVDENVPLQTKVDLLSQEYQTLCGAMTVLFDGKERTLPEMSKFLLETDRHLRERAWAATAQRRLADQERLDHLFNEMLKLRCQIARNAKFSNFTEYQFRAFQRFDYTPQDCKQYHETIEEVVLPLWREILEKRRQEMKLEKLRPWDTAVDPLGQKPLKPFENIEQLYSRTKEIFLKMDSVLGQQFSQMVEEGLLDLESRKGKAPGGYQSTLDNARKPFIFMNAVGVDDDIWTLFHESGHAFHALACADQRLLKYRHAPMEFNEVASMGMELLASQSLDYFYGSTRFACSPLDQSARSRQAHLEDIIFTLVWVATIDCFQHWIYEHPFHTNTERKEAWLNIRKRFGGNFVDWSGLEEEHGFLWHRQLHIFEYPFYYIEYGIAQLGALQLWLNAKKDGKAALDNYKKALALGGSQPLPKLYEEAGIQFDFSVRMIAPLMEAIKNELHLK